MNTISFNLSLQNYAVKPHLKRKGRPQYLVSTLFIGELVIENNKGSGKIVIPKDSERNLVQSGSRIPPQTKLC